MQVVEKVRILHVVGSMGQGGIQSLLMNIYRNIDHSKIQFDFIVHTNQKGIFDDEIIKLGGKIFHCPKYNGKNHFKYVKWWNEFFLYNKEYKLIHGHIRSTAAIYLLLAKKYDIITVAHSHSISAGKGILGIIKKIMQYPIRYISDYMFACSLNAGVWLFGKKACKKENFYIFNNGIKAYNFIFNNNIRREKRRELGIKNEFVIGHVGRFHYSKNHRKLVDIFKEVHEKEKKAILLLIGDGEEKDFIIDEVKKYGLEKSVVFLGTRLDIADLMQVMDVFVFPSLWEGLGIGIIEAEASGLPCIISNKIPKDVFITNLVTSIDINASSKTWADTILKYGIGYKRENTYNLIKKANYDIIENIKWIQEFYLEKY